MHARSVASAMSVWRVSVVTSHSNSAKRAPKIPFSQCSPTCTRAGHTRMPWGAWQPYFMTAHVHMHMQCPRSAHAVHIKVHTRCTCSSE